MATLAEVLRQAGYVTPQGQVVGPRTDLAQKLKSYVMNIPQNAAQNLANQRADIDAALTMGQGGIQIGDREAFARQMAEVPNLMGAIAYHGTPHTIKGKFDISKVGTGEGAQAYGHGMYFAENPSVATQYKNILSKPEFTKNAEGIELRGQLPRMLEESYSELTAKNGIQQTNYGDVVDVVKQRLDRQMKDALKSNDMDWYNKVADMKIDLARFKENPPPNTGNLYKVDIPDEYIPNMLDWDKPISQQPKIIQDAFKQAISIEGDPYNLKRFKNPVGADFYYGLTKNNATDQLPKEASDFLNNLGIKGIRYLDEGSRNAQQRWIARHPKGGESDFPTLEQAQAFINKYPNDKYTLIEPKPLTSNFVVFEPSEVKILEQNNKPMTRKEIIEQELEKVAK